jgi:hypothetical protein
MLFAAFMLLFLKPVPSTCTSRAPASSHSTTVLAAGSCSHRDLPKRVYLICIALNDADRMESPFGQVPNFEGYFMLD